jgi:hypothetical protein
MERHISQAIANGVRVHEKHPVSTAGGICTYPMLTGFQTGNITIFLVIANNFL